MRYILITISILAAWFGMQACHELGHVALACASGGTVDNVDLFPAHFSRTDVSNNPHPLLVVWGGPVVGVLLPLCIWGASVLLRSTHAFLARFLAGFCLTANGAYIAIGSFDGIGDSGDMLRLGSPIWTLWLFGAVCILGGFSTWHRLAPDFGIGATAKPVKASSIVAATGTLIALLVVGICVGE